MSMKKLATLILFFLIAGSLVAQENPEEMVDIIYLKDGGVVRGVILEKQEGNFVRILVGRKQKQEIKFADIEKMDKEEMNEVEVTFVPRKNRMRGYAMQAELGVQQDRSDTSLSRVQLDIVNGFRINSFISLGAGIGLRFYTGAKDLLIPVYGNLRIKLLNKRVSPYASLSYGYSFDSSNGDEGILFKGMGTIFRPSLGLSVQTFRRSYLCAGIQMEQQQFRQASDSQSYFYSTAGTGGDFTSRAFGFFVGYGF